MAKGVLGNDPFLRGAAKRVPAKKAASDSSAPAGPAAPAAPDDVTQEYDLTEVEQSHASPFKPHKDSPVLVAKLEGKEPTAHPASPTLVSIEANGKGRGPTPHADSPDVVATLGDTPTPHSGSPDVVATLGEEPLPHRASPELVAVLDGSQTPHADSPRLSEAIPEARDARESNTFSNLSSTARAGAEMLSQMVSGPALEQAMLSARGLVKALRSAVGVGAGLNLDSYGKDPELVRSLQPLADFLYDYYFRVEVIGAENLPEGAAILVSNHSGALPLDGPVLHHALTRERPDLTESRWLVEDQIFFAPVLGTLINRLGAIRASPENATRLLEEGRPVIVFPEGLLGIGKPFSERYQLKRFGRGGYVKLALRNQVPIVPVSIVGAEESMPLLGKLPGRWLGLPYLPLTSAPLPTKWSIRFGEPVTLPKDASLADDPRYVQEVNEQVKGSIGSLLTSLLTARASVF